MNGKYQPGQKVFLTEGNKNLIKEATVLKHTGGFYTIRFETVVKSRYENPGSALPVKSGSSDPEQSSINRSLSRYREIWIYQEGKRLCRMSKRKK